MEIKVPRDELKSAVAATKKALAKVVIQEERAHLLFTVTGNHMSVQGTNNDLKARCELHIENAANENFAFTADPKILEKLLSKIDMDQVRVAFDPSDFIVKVYTTDSEKSFSSLQSFPADKMLTFEDPSKIDGRTDYAIDKDVLVFSLNYAKNFLAAAKDDQKQFDFVVINKGIVYAANGTNKMGFVVFKAFAKIENFKIRKIILPMFLAFVKDIGGDTVHIVETPKDIGLVSPDGNMYLSCLKSNIDTPNIPKEHIVSEGPYTKIDKNRLIKVVDRLMVSNTSASNSGIELNLTSKGENACLQINLVSSLKVTESFPCVRVNDNDGGDITHVVDYKIFKSILTAFETDSEVRLHINDASKGYKIYNGGEVNGNKYILVGRGSYAKVVKQ